MILVPRVLFHAVRSACERAYPEEGCGLLIGRRSAAGVVVRSVVASPNVAEDGRRHERFAVDPTIQFRALRRLRGTGLAVVGHYHAHPDGQPVPSATDLACAFDSSLIWLISAVVGGHATMTRAFAPDPDGRRFAPVDLRITA